MHVHIVHKWHNVEVNPIPFSNVATTKPRRDQLKLPVMIHSFHFSRHRWRHAVNNLSPAIRAKWFESWTFKKNMFWVFSDAAITYTTPLFNIPGEPFQYHGCWCPGWRHRHIISSHHGDCVGQMGPLLPWGIISTLCAISMLRNDTECESIFMCPKIIDHNKS